MPFFRVRWIVQRRKHEHNGAGLMSNEFIARHEGDKYVTAETSNDAVAAVRDEAIAQVAAETQDVDGQPGIQDIEFNLVSVTA